MTIQAHHWLINQTYVLQDDGSILVEDHKSGRTGRFNTDGDWLDGELKYADGHMLEWVGRPQAILPFG
jgi:hypothetical protein